MDIKNLSVDSIDLSVRSSNALHRAGIHTVGAMILQTEESLADIRNLGSKSIQEILEKISEYKKLDDEQYALYKPSDISFDEWITDEDNRNVFKAWLKERGTRIDVLELLSPLSYNILALSDREYLYQIAFESVDDLMEISRMTDECALEIVRVTSHYLRGLKDEFFAGQETKAANVSKPKSLNEYMDAEEYRPVILDFVKKNDVEIEYMGLSARPVNVLLAAGYRKMSDMIFLDYGDIMKLPKAGRGTADEILSKIRSYLDTYEERIMAVISGDTKALFDDASIGKSILDLYKSAGFNGLSFNDFVDMLHLPEEFELSLLKKIIGHLIADKELEYVDYRCYRVYDRFEDYLNSCDALDERSKDFILRRLKGDTLETIGQDNGVTRERVRQIVSKGYEKLRADYSHTTGNYYFDEDFYMHLYATYKFDKKDAAEWFGITPNIWNYLEMTEAKQGKRNLDSALTDEGLSAGLRLKIKNYLNRNKLYIDGMWIDKKRADLEELVARKFCRDDVSFDDYCKLYNSFLEQEEIPYDEKIYYTDSVIRTRMNKLMKDRFLLWKQNELIRYYDIEGRDYTDLLDVLNLASYENVEYSTSKFIRDYPEIMEQYDIRDEYELHNLLRKILPDGSFHSFHCGRMPNIKFGEFDRDKAIKDILMDLAPISKKDLVDKISEIYGYDTATIAGNGLDCISIYEHHGMYTVDQAKMSEENMSALKNALTGDFYFIREIRRVYKELFPDADLNEINPYNLKIMGFNCYVGYAVQHYPTADSYFRDLLTRDDVIDISSYRKRFTYIQGFGKVLSEMKLNLDIVEYEPNNIISIKKLENSGITRDVIREFCDAVYDYADQGSYFTMKSLKASGFMSPLFDYGFEDWFYANLLITDDRFSYCKMFGNIILCKGKNAVTFKSFLLQVINDYVCVDMFDLMNDINDKYGCKVTQKADVIEAVKGTAVYYDKLLDRLYTNKDRYYSEIIQGGL